MPAACTGACPGPFSQGKGRAAGRVRPPPSSLAGSRPQTAAAFSAGTHPEWSRSFVDGFLPLAALQNLAAKTAVKEGF